MLEVSIIKANEIRQEEVAIWRDMCAQNDYFQSPLLSFDFFFEVSKQREDAFVAVFKQNEKPIAFWAHHRRPKSFARPIGAPFSDYSALITYPDANISIQEALKLAGIEKFRAIGWIDPYGLSADFNGETEEAHAMDFRTDEKAHSASKKHRKNVNRLKRHLNEKYGETKFIFDDRNREHFNQMIEIKRRQTYLTGVHDFLSPTWVKGLIENLWNAPRSGLHGLMITMTVNDKPVAWQFGPSLGKRGHPWIFAYDDAYSSYSPGQIYLMDLSATLIENGIEYYDLSTGSQQYKRTFCNRHSIVKHGVITPEIKAVKPLNEGKLQSIGARFSRRLDQIACLELETKGRFDGVVFALKSMSKRFRKGAD